MTELVTYQLGNGVATITLDDGKANVMSEKMIRAVATAFDRAEADRAVVLLTGRPGMFSAGYDLATFSRSEDEIRQTLRAGGNLIHRLLGFPLPVVAACSGHAIAQGAFTLLAADVRFGIAGDFKLGLNEVAIGLTIPHYGVEVARHRLTRPGFDRAMNTGILVGPEEARELGFLDALVADADELHTRATAEAHRLTEIDLGAHAWTKLRVRAQVLTAVRSGIDSEFGA
ncbi:crotonase/enoyl-CoA hydratase family protein [Nocardia sp. CNY236]|uniref:crotonase/enoyl-CoA hydratase family protein n=1 Tax=Nocardia sp. CNY236 TaxID=1169152 RepID=UPI0004058DF0|nr:crotonase/enoyl-CoA hydratase family protein [Nocardia sp. CNY236]